MTAAAVARDRALGRPSNELTILNRAKVVRYRGDDGAKIFDDMVRRVGKLDLSGAKKAGEKKSGGDKNGEKKAATETAA
jgi:hypothetical protein